MEIYFKDFIANPDSFPFASSVLSRMRDLYLSIFPLPDPYLSYELRIMNGTAKGVIYYFLEGEIYDEEVISEKWMHSLYNKVTNYGREF